MYPDPTVKLELAHDDHGAALTCKYRLVVRETMEVESLPRPISVLGTLGCHGQSAPNARSVTV
jgi:hypothetical protein